MKKDMLTREEIIHIADLANIKLTEEETTKFQTQLSSILEYIKKLNEVDTSSVEPTSQVTGLVDVTEPDGEKSERTLSPQEALRNTADKTDNYFKVKAIFNEDTNV
jgi:aspartyl-tRNA(Asn)/glutamyl-tRNA(Gln) amidotransferase subunit C